MYVIRAAYRTRAHRLFMLSGSGRQRAAGGYSSGESEIVCGYFIVLPQRVPHPHVVQGSQYSFSEKDSRLGRRSNAFVLLSVSQRVSLYTLLSFEQLCSLNSLGQVSLYT